MDLKSESRDYEVYLDLMSSDPAVQAKFSDIREFIRPGIVVDDGCGDGMKQVDYPPTNIVAVAGKIAVKLSTTYSFLILVIITRTYGGEKIQRPGRLL